MTEPIKLDRLFLKQSEINPKIATVKINDVDVSNSVSRIEMIWAAGECPVITLSFIGYLEVPELLAHLFIKEDASEE